MKDMDCVLASYLGWVLVLICPDSNRKMCKYVVVFPKRPQAEDLTFNIPEDSWEARALSTVTQWSLWLGLFKRT